MCEDYGYNDRTQGGSGQVFEQEYDCGKKRSVVRHQHVVKHQHDIVNEYDVVHVHDFNYYDVVKQREVVRHNDFTSYQPNYCGDSEYDCGDDARYVQYASKSNRHWTVCK